MDGGGPRASRRAPGLEPGLDDTAVVAAASWWSRDHPRGDLSVHAAQGRVSSRVPVAAGFVINHNFGGGPLAAVRAGASHGLYCLGCCWALMAVLAVLGLMNIAWMALFAAIFFIEKNVRFGDVVPGLVGAACISGGLVIVA